MVFPNLSPDTEHEKRNPGLQASPNREASRSRHARVEGKRRIDLVHHSTMGMRKIKKRVEGLRRIDLVHHSTMGMRKIKKRVEGLRRTDLVYHSSLGLRVMQKKESVGERFSGIA